MYSTMFENKKIRISDKSRRLLLKRFNKDKFIRTALSKVAGITIYKPQMRNETPCALCELFHGTHSCGHCPFKSFEHDHVPGCSYVINCLLSTEAIALCPSFDTVEYNITDKTSALSNLRVITDFLKSFKKEK